MLVKTFMVLSTLVSPTLRTEFQPLVVLALYQKRLVVSRTHLKKTKYHGVRNTPFVGHRLGKPCKDCVVIRSLTGDPVGNPPSPYGSVGNAVPRYGAQSELNFPAIVVNPHLDSFWAPGWLWLGKNSCLRVTALGHQAFQW